MQSIYMIFITCNYYWKNDKLGIHFQNNTWNRTPSINLFNLLFFSVRLEFIILEVLEHLVCDFIRVIRNALEVRVGEWLEQELWFFKKCLLS